jgi:hypothetical protein
MKKAKLTSNETYFDNQLKAALPQMSVEELYEARDVRVLNKNAAHFAKQIAWINESIETRLSK